MKTTKIFAAAAAALVLIVFGSCSQDNEKELYNGEVRFTAGIKQEATHGRAANTEWAQNDAIGIFMVGNGTTNISMEAENKKYTTTNAANGAFQASSEADKIYYPQAGKVDFIAYYPWKEAQELGVYNVEIKTPQNTLNQPTFDLLYATADNRGMGYDKNTTGSVEFAFVHRLSKLILHCKADASIGVPITNMTVKITGMDTQTTFDLATGEWSETHSTPLAITPRKLGTIPEGFQAAFDAIILPRKVATHGDVTVEFTINGDLFVWKVPGGTEFEEGKKHIYEITIKRTSVDFKAIIEPWTDGMGGQGIAE